MQVLFNFYNKNINNNAFIADLLTIKIGFKFQRKVIL